MKSSVFKHIVKESLREAFYTKKVNESTDRMWVGVVDSYGKVHAKNVDYEDWTQHNVMFPSIRGDRWRFDSGDTDIVWTNEPSKDSLIAVEDYLIKNGEHPTIKSGLTESINPQKVTVRYCGEVLPAIISKNTKPGEKEYRISGFSNVTGDVNPRGHIDLSEQEVQELLQNNKLPDDVIRKFGNTFKIINPSPQEGVVIEPLKEDVNNNLLLLENSSREIDLWLENKIETIEESMNVVVSGASYQRTDRLDELVNYLQDTVVSPILRKMTNEQEIAYFHKNSVGFWNVLSTDGSYHENPDGDLSIGTINLYPGGITSKYLRPIVVGILRQLKKLGIKWGQLKREPSGAYKISDVIRFPIISNGSKNYQGPPELNLSNVNSYNIFHNLLQYDGENEFSMKASELIERIETILNHDPSWVEKNQRKHFDSNWPKQERDDEPETKNPHDDIINQLGLDGPRIISFGQDKNRILEILHRILEIAKWAKNHGHEDVQVS